MSSARHPQAGVVRLKETTDDSGKPVAYEGSGMRGSTAGHEFLIVCPNSDSLRAVMEKFEWGNAIDWANVKACVVTPGAAK